MNQIVNTTEDAIALLQSLSAPPRLVQHHRLVLEAARKLVEGLMQACPQFVFDAQLVLIGVALHDAGKVLHQEEIIDSGNQHERDGEQMLLTLGVSPVIARFCRTHARWTAPDTTIEDWLVALADTLWKGCRNEQLETKVIKAIVAMRLRSMVVEHTAEGITQQVDQDYWDIFVSVDSVFEAIANDADKRLRRSIV